MTATPTGTASGRACPRRVVLRDGSVLCIREIEPTDGERLVRFHQRLSPDSVRMRYFSAHPHLSAVETVRLTTVDHRDRQAFVALADNDIVGVGRYERTGAAGQAEVAFVVADEWQGRGIGAALLERLVEHARSCGFHQLTASTLAHNPAMLAVFHRSGLPVETSLESGIVDVVLSLD